MWTTIRFNRMIINHWLISQFFGFNSKSNLLRNCPVQLRWASKTFFTRDPFSRMARRQKTNGLHLSLSLSALSVINGKSYKCVIPHILLLCHCVCLCVCFCLFLFGFVLFWLFFFFLLCSRLRKSKHKHKPWCIHIKKRREEWLMGLCQFHRFSSMQIPWMTKKSDQPKKNSMPKQNFFVFFSSI